MRAILLDIEGTVTDKRFVTEKLFPYARERMHRFLSAHAQAPEVASALAALRAKLGRPGASVDELASELVRWIDEDRKEEPLKSLQGLIWRAGYESGALVSHIYPDVPPALRRWRNAGLRLAIFSSGSVPAQKLLFAHTREGDLTPYLGAYFDLSTGPKNEAASYAGIAEALELAPAEIRFYSDAPKEVGAAASAGMVAVLVERDGPVDASGAWRHISDFTQERP